MLDPRYKLNGFPDWEKMKARILLITTAETFHNACQTNYNGINYIYLIYLIRMYIKQIYVNNNLESLLPECSSTNFIENYLLTSQTTQRNALSNMQNMIEMVK